MMKTNKALWAMCILVAAGVLAGYSPETYAGTTILRIDPPVVTGVAVGSYFTVNVSVVDVIDLYGWQFSLYYRGDVLNVTKIEEGPFLHRYGYATQYLVPIMTDSYNSTHGLILAACSLQQVPSGVSGSGTLASITFKVKQPSSSTLHLTSTKLVDSAVPFGNLIPHTTVDGIVVSGVRDVAVTNVQVSPTSVIQGQAVAVNVTVANFGTQPETFSVTAYYDSSVIGTKTVNSLASGLTSLMTFSWSTVGVEPDRAYVISAQAETVLGESNLGNNVLVDGSVAVRGQVVVSMKIAQVLPCNQTGSAKNSFSAGSLGYFKVIVNNTSVAAEVLVTVNAYDSSNATLGVAWFKGTIVPGTSTFILGLPIRSTTALGTAFVYANIWTDWPYFGGTPLGLDVSASFQIVSA